MVNDHSSSRASSRLAELFAQRCGLAVEESEAAIRGLARGLSGDLGESVDLDVLLPLRSIDPQVELTEDLLGDGVIEPKGSTYGEGFRMRLKRGRADRRQRFTKAHEICHTFFYELVPEMKFLPHAVDPTEERLCNLGAEELLIPRLRLDGELEGVSESIESLDRLAGTFDVSLAAMLLRLRNAGIWYRELAYWHRMVDGTFVLDKRVGGARKDWQIDTSIIYTAWENGGKVETGVTDVIFDNGRETGAKRVHYQALRRGSLVITLTGQRKFKKREKKPPLFCAAAAR